MYLYIYIYRERDIWYTYITCVCIYIYIYIRRKGTNLKTNEKVAVKVYKMHKKKGGKVHRPIK